MIKGKCLSATYLCISASVSRSGYYYWKKYNHESFLRDKDSVDLIRKVHKRFHAKAGIRTIRMYLEFKFGIVMNTKKIARIKRQYGIATEIRRHNRYKAFNKSIQEDATAPNLLNREFRRKKPDEVYSTDITYLNYYGGKRAYLSAVKDLSSREVVHYNISRNLNMELAYEGLDKLFEELRPEIIHSDQGFHYRNRAYRNILEKHGIAQSMSRKGNCLDNAPIESFFGHMKDEINLKNCKSFEEVKEMIDSYIHYYNNDRPQWTLKKMTPAQYRRHLNY